MLYHRLLRESSNSKYIAIPWIGGGMVGIVRKVGR
jgi:hypothetical protein